ncbi:MAG: hypothetical protein AB1755_04555 [Candidatus Omnitrophota bacterium]
MPPKAFINNKQWAEIDGVLCKITKFLRFDKTQEFEINGRKYYPYAVLSVICSKFTEPVTGLIFHKQDYKHLCMAFEKVEQGQEVLIFWSNNHYKSWAKIFSPFMPKLWVMVCPGGAFEIETNKDYRPEITGEARWNAFKPIIEWKPEVMV